MGRLEIKKNIGILGGTFDPVHFGHLKLAEAARVKLNLDLVLFVPARRPPHKNRPNIIDVKLRYEMIKRAIKGNRYFRICRIEMEKSGLSYSVETLRALGRRYPQSTFYFLVGSDAIPELKTWKNIDEIFALCVFVIAKRPGFDGNRLPEGAVVLDGVFPDISSSTIRQMLKTGESVEKLIPKDVCQFIRERKLYH